MSPDTRLLLSAVGSVVALIVPIARLKVHRLIALNPAHGAAGLARAGTTFSARRTLEGGAAARGAEVAPKAADRMSGSSRLAVTSILVPRGSVSGRSNQ